LRNFGLSLTSKAVSLAAHVAFVMLTARLFSKEEVAVIAIAGILTILMDACKGFGLGTVLLKRLPAMSAQPTDDSRALIASYLFYSLLPPLLLTVIGLAMPQRLVWPELGVSTGSNAIRMGLLLSLFTVLSNTNLLVLQATQNFGQLAAMTLVTAALCRCSAADASSCSPGETSGLNRAISTGHPCCVTELRRWTSYSSQFCFRRPRWRCTTCCAGCIRSGWC
jgi:O-antigen/teichoic acid export membrane protein